MSLLGALPSVVPTPPEHRLWMDEECALEILRCTSEELQQLVDSGFVGEGGQYDDCDVWNLGLLSGTGRTRPELETMFLARMLKSFRADWVSPQRYEIIGSVECPRGSDCPSPEWDTPALPDVRWIEGDVQAGRAEWRGEVELRGQNATVHDPRVRDVWDDLTAHYRFHFTPEKLASEVHRTRERKVGDCDALCRLLMADLLDCGIATELQPGYIHGGARLRRHSWLRIVDSDGQSKILDPSMALLADTFITPQYKDFCYGSSLNRMVRRTKHEDAVAFHPCVEGTGVPYDFVLRRV